MDLIQGKVQEKNFRSMLITFSVCCRDSLQPVLRTRWRFRCAMEHLVTYRTCLTCLLWYFSLLQIVLFWLFDGEGRLPKLV